MQSQFTVPVPFHVVTVDGAANHLRKRFAMMPQHLADNPSLSLAAKGMYTILAADWWAHDWECRLSLTELTRRAGCSRSQTIHLLDKLVERGAITRERLGGRNENVYRPASTGSLTLPIDEPLVASDYQTSSERLPVLVSTDYQLPDSPLKSKENRETKKHPRTSGATRASKPKAEKRGSRIPDDWTLTDEHYAYAESKGLDRRRTEIEGEKFLNHWRSVAGTKGVKMDWFSTWRVWVLRDAPTSQPRGNGTRPGWPTTPPARQHANGPRRARWGESDADPEPIAAKSHQP